MSVARPRQSTTSRTKARDLEDDDDDDDDDGGDVKSTLIIGVPSARPVDRL